jgi:O-antigen/teichoic acid export membrane protein
MLRNIGSNWAITIVNVLVTFVLTAYVIETLGDVHYGVWLIIAALTTYLELIRGGLPAASVRYIAEGVGSGRPERVQQAVASALWLYGVLSAVAFVVGLGLLGFFTVAYELAERWEGEAHLAFLLAMLNIAFGFVAHLPYAVLEAHDDFITRNYIRFAALVLRLVATLSLLWWVPSIVMLAATLMIVTAFELVTATWIVRGRYALKVSMASRSPELVRGLFRYGTYVLLLAVGYRLAFQSDALVIGRWRMADVAVYSVANSLLLYLIEFVNAVGIVVMPRAAKLREQRDDAGLRALLMQSSRTAITVALLIGGYLLVMGPTFISWWLGPDFGVRGADALRILTVSFFLFLPVSGAAVPILMGVGNVAVPAASYLVMGLVNVGVSLWLVPRYGIAGAALGTAAPNVLFAIAMMAWTCRETGQGLGAYVRYTFGRPVLGAGLLIGLLALVLWRWQPHGFFGLAVTGVVYVTLFGGIWAGFVYRNDPYVDWRQTRIGRWIVRRLRLRTGE